MRRGPALLASLVLLACNSPKKPPPGAAAAEASRAAAVPPGPRLIPYAPEGPLAETVRARIATAASQDRRVLVYIGAEWCEPCRHFHAAIESGALDEAFPRVDFLEFDFDQHRGPLKAAGYQSRLLPLFVVPAADGRASDAMEQGGIKGEGAVDHIRPRLERLLARTG